MLPVRKLVRRYSQFRGDPKEQTHTCVRSVEMNVHLETELASSQVEGGRRWDLSTPSNFLVSRQELRDARKVVF